MVPKGLTMDRQTGWSRKVGATRTVVSPPISSTSFSHSYLGHGTSARCSLKRRWSARSVALNVTACTSPDTVSFASRAGGSMLTVSAPLCAQRRPASEKTSSAFAPSDQTAVTRGIGPVWVATRDVRR